MVSFVTDYVQDTAAKYLGAGITAVGTLAGNAVGGVGGLIENSGRNVGNGVAGGIGGVGGYINGYGDSLRGSMAADGPVRGGTQKTAVKQGATPNNLQRVKQPANKPLKSIPATTSVPSKPAIKPATTKSLPASAKRPSSTNAPIPSGAPSALPSKKVSNGKVTISAESRPRKSTTPAVKPSAVDQKLKKAPPASVAHIPRV